MCKYTIAIYLVHLHSCEKKTQRTIISNKNIITLFPHYRLSKKGLWLSPYARCPYLICVAFLINVRHQITRFPSLLVS